MSDNITIKDVRTYSVSAEGGGDYHLQEKGDAKYMFLISIKDIKAGEELTANYNLYTYPKTGIGLQSF